VDGGLADFYIGNPGKSGSGFFQLADEK